MVSYSDEVLQDMESLFSDCNHILEEDISDQVMDQMHKRITLLQKQSEEYKENLLDQESNSKSPVSREMASLLLTEDRKIRDMIERYFSPAEDTMRMAGARADVNVGALYVEYLTGRALQSTREALIGAMNLKILSKNAGDTSQKMTDAS